MEEPKQAVRATWTHDGDECVAVVGEHLKWRSPVKGTVRFDMWRYGATVVAIEPNGTVYLDPAEHHVWNDIVQCPSSVRIEYENE